ncbi:MAG TPA: LysR family transcriptional regulator [Solirubrobacteraceae bacterium]|jgi:DNA-binding transcriptional LysR family regulator|nr:LysR family transcriptional regulator [Solirubrobacteraceae bacterium]
MSVPAEREPPGAGVGLARTLDVKAAEVFVTVAEELHFGRAAARVHMTQPAVSRHVTRLEAALGVTLLHRTNRHVALTPEGRVFLGAAREALAAGRRAVQTAQLASRGATGQLEVGSAGTLPNELAWQLVREFRRRHPAVEIHLSQFSYPSAPLAGIDCEQCDVAFVRAPLSTAGVGFEPLVREPRVAVLAREHPLAGARALALEQFAREPVVTIAGWPRRLRDHWAGVDDGAPAGYAIGALAGGLGEWLAALGEGRGVSLCPASIVSFYAREDLSFVPVVDLAESTIGLCWRLDRDGPALRNFIAYARTHFAERGAGQPRAEPAARLR